jgi:O-antigen/teichoic acid export membrane protein
MKIGQTSVVVFLSKLLGSALGFLATLYFARLLGAEVVGLYALVLTVVGWLLLIVEVGIGGATVKRISEGKEQGKYLTAAVTWVLLFGTVISIGVVLGRPLLESYIHGFTQKVGLSVAWFVVAITFVRLFRSTVRRALKGERKVHIVGLLEPVNAGGRSVIQIGLVFAGFGLFGMLVGYMLGTALVGLVGLFWVTTRPAWPSKRHFRSLFDYAKFSWLSKLEARVFTEVDLLLLGVFVPTSLVGVYSIAWSLANFLSLFGAAIRSVLFPEVSYTSTQESNQAAAGMLESALAYTGLLSIPGLVGGAILGDRLLMLYGGEFVEGTVVLGLLILAVLFYSYQKQLINGLNGLDRPDLAFRVNALFILLNAGLNVVLIWLYGIEGAAVATAFSAAVTLAFSYYVLSQLITFDLPVRQIAHQWIAALGMGLVVLGARRLIEVTGVTDHNAVIVVVLVGLGAVVYFLALLAISARFRTTVRENLPARFR